MTAHHHEHHHQHATPIPSLPGELRWSVERSLWLLGLLLCVAYWGVSSFSLPAFALFVGLSGLTLCLGHSVGLHRGVIHSSFKTSRWLERVFMYLATLAGMGAPLSMMRMHELRDFWQNEPAAPEFYSYAHGPWRDFIWYLHTDHHPAIPAHDHPVTLPARFEQDPFYQWLQSTWMLQQLPVALACFLLAGWGGVIWGVCARVAISCVGHWLVNYVAHTRGYHSWEIEGSGEQGRNSLLFGALSMGEGWHNNHHAWPNSARLGLEWWEVDAGYMCVWGLQKLGLIWDVQLAGQVSPVRPIHRVTHQHADAQQVLKDQPRELLG